MPFGIDIPPKKDPEFSLEIFGTRYRGWTSVQVDRGLEQFAHSFSLGYTDQWDDSEPWEILRGDQCTLRFGRTAAITGSITNPRKAVGGTTYDLNADGRSNTADLVDCTAIHGSGRWRNATLGQIAKDLCEPFAITVHDNVGDTKKFKRFDLDEGETAHSALDRACQMRGCLPVTRADGDVDISRYDGLIALVDLDLETVIRRSVSDSEQDRYSHYTFKGQTHADDEHFSYNAATKKGEARDPGVARYRPLIILAEEAGSKEDLGKRAIWERNVRIARSYRLSYTLSGFADSDGDLWMPGGVIKVRDPVLKVHDTFLIVKTSMTLDAGKKSTILDLVDPVAYSVVE